MPVLRLIQPLFCVLVCYFLCLTSAVPAPFSPWSALIRRESDVGDNNSTGTSPNNDRFESWALRGWRHIQYSLPDAEFLVLIAYPEPRQGGSRRPDQFDTLTYLVRAPNGTAYVTGNDEAQPYRWSPLARNTVVPEEGFQPWIPGFGRWPVSLADAFHVLQKARILRTWGKIFIARLASRPDRVVYEFFEYNGDVAVSVDVETGEIWIPDGVDTLSNNTAAAATIGAVPTS